MNFCGNPPGLEAIYQICSCLYPNQPNPLQVTAVVKCWLGGPDPLDYISMYSNDGDGKNVPPHWHYISLGLTDLYGDGRVHIIQKEGRSGIGFELSFRLKKEFGENTPPTWPATLLQALARYILHTGNIICGGDHISWGTALCEGMESKVKHMLLMEDPQLQPASTHLGTIYFLQIVGVLKEEMEAAQHWHGPGVLALMKKLSNCGGEMLVTDMHRSDSMFLLSSSTQDRIDKGIVEEGSNLSGVVCHVYWNDGDKSQAENGGESRHFTALPDQSLTYTDIAEIKESLRKGLTVQAEQVTNNTKCEQLDSTSSANKNLPTLSSEFYDTNLREINRARSVADCSVYMDLESAKLLPLVIRGRLKHSRHFTYKNLHTSSAVTFVTNSIQGTLVDEEHAMAAVGNWLQIHIEECNLENFLMDIIDKLSDLDINNLPKTWRWEDRKLNIIIFAHN